MATLHVDGKLVNSDLRWRRVSKQIVLSTSVSYALTRIRRHAKKVFRQHGGIERWESAERDAAGFPVAAELWRLPINAPRRAHAAKSILLELELLTTRDQNMRERRLLRIGMLIERMGLADVIERDERNREVKRTASAKGNAKKQREAIGRYKQIAARYHTQRSKGYAHANAVKNVADALDVSESTVRNALKQVPKPTTKR